MRAAFINHDHYHLPRMTEMKRLYFAHSIACLGHYLVTIFVPIYLLKLGYPVESVILFFFLTGLAWACSAYPGAQLTGVLGANRTMAIGNVLDVVFLMLLISLPGHHWPLWLLAVVNGSQSAFYLNAFRANFSKARSHDRAGKQVGLMGALVLFLHGAAPAVGGVIATAFGVNVAYAVAIGFLSLASLPLLLGPEVTRHRKLNLRRLKPRQIVPDLIANAVYTVLAGADTVFWPLLIYLIIKSYAGIGALSSLITIAAIIASLYVGNREAVKGKRHYLRQGNTLIAFTNLLRILAQNTSHIMGINLVGGVGNALQQTPYFSRYYERADQLPRVEYVFYMQLASGLGFVLLFGTAYALIQFVHPNTVVILGLVLAAPASLVMSRVLR